MPEDPKKPSTLRSYQQCNTSGMREKEKQDLLWGAIDESNLSNEEKVHISLILPYSPSDLK